MVTPANNEVHFQGTGLPLSGAANDELPVIVRETGVGSIRQEPGHVTQDHGGTARRITKLTQLNELRLETVDLLARNGQLDPLINDINDLKGVKPEVLKILYNYGHEPDVQRFAGRMRGSDLALPHHDRKGFGNFVGGIMRYTQPWGGKQTKSHPRLGKEGTGNNQMFLCLPGGAAWFFEFNWALVKSKLDQSFAGNNAKVIRLDYATPNNMLNELLGVNMIHDEIREIGPKDSGVNLGMAALIEPKHKREPGVSGAIRSAIAGLAGSFWKTVYNVGLRLDGRDERIGKSKDPIEFVYFGLQSSKAQQS